MDNKKLKYWGIAAATIYISSILFWQYTHAGVESHHLLHDENLPSFSNWWGLITLPLLTWFTFYRIEKRKEINYKLSFIRFLCAFAAAMAIGIGFTMGSENIPYYVLITCIVMGLFYPTYLTEFLLGFVIGLTYFFGGILPIIIGMVIISIGGILYLIRRKVIDRLFAKLR